MVPISATNTSLNSVYQGGNLDPYVLDVGHAITPNLKATIGYHYQNGDQNSADGSEVNGRVAYNISHGLTAGVNPS